MAEIYAVGRPYARAVFELARDQDALEAWSDGLAFAAQVAGDPEIQALATNPKADQAAFESMVVELCQSKMPAEGVNLVRLLLANRRLAALPSIAAQYESLRAEAEQTVDAEMISARPVAAEQREKVESALQKKLGRKVRLTVVEDDSVLGGAVIRAGDLVIDGSVRGRLEKLAGALTH